MLILYGVVFIMEGRNRRRLRRARACGAQTRRAPASKEFPAPRGRHARVQAPARTAPAHACAPDLDAAAERSIFRIADVDGIDWKMALKIGCFQVLAIIPGTSRSGATIIGGMLCGCSRTAAAEFTFFLAIPIMFGWGLVKCVKFAAAGLAMTTTEAVVLAVGVVSAFARPVSTVPDGDEEERLHGVRLVPHRGGRAGARASGA